MTTVLLVRHGETAWNREGRIQGWAPTGLTDAGHDQARALAAHVADEYDVDRVLASDLRRARETAAHLEESTGVAATHEPAWRERDFGRLQGLLAEDLFGRFPEFSVAEEGQAAATEPLESGESLVETRERVVARWERLRAESNGETVAVVAHGGPIHLLLGAVRDADAVESILEHEQDNCGLNELRVGEAGVDVVRENDTGFL